MPMRVKLSENVSATVCVPLAPVVTYIPSEVGRTKKASAQLNFKKSLNQLIWICRQLNLPEGTNVLNSGNNRILGLFKTGTT